MRHIWIINQNTSTPLFYNSYSEMVIDPDLVSGLLTALNNFSEIELKSHGISSIDMAGLRWVYLDHEELNLLIIAAGEKESNAEVMRSRLEVIAKMFIQNFDLTKEKLKKSIIKIDQFDEFKNILNMLQDQWNQAELVMGAAAMFDLLGVFQQIFNHMHQVIKLNFFGEKRLIIDKAITEFTNELMTSDEIQQNPELSKISYEYDMGWSCINLNPTWLDEDVLKHVLFRIITELIAILKANSSRMALYYAFSQEIYPYLLNQYELLDRLGINKILLRKFLE